MNGKKVLFVSSEVIPYLPNNDISSLTYALPKMVNENGPVRSSSSDTNGNRHTCKADEHEYVLRYYSSKTKGPNTVYFAKSFHVDDPMDFTSFQVEAKFHQGIILYKFLIPSDLEINFS